MILDIRGDREQGSAWAGISIRTKWVCLVNGYAPMPEAATSQVVHVGPTNAGCCLWEPAEVEGSGCQQVGEVCSLQEGVGSQEGL